MRGSSYLAQKHVAWFRRTPRTEEPDARGQSKSISGPSKFTRLQPEKNQGLSIFKGRGLVHEKCFLGALFRHQTDVGTFRGISNLERTNKIHQHAQQINVDIL